ncbi:nucleotidyltransferase domain protein [Clostridium tepidiprofundi DSM 19306]|uniref:Nucleotidyltransferase domain protein n=1 Tax=Clostridium tepidiprofundi DSM 19306 TaxID=1121338 RepID=A0A151B6B8_9CLOT|nr:nucleotidyltransferase domain-containing protein [Clostridium tepidiprofundi]KYH35343.1 nucleotidyltransferase domain protein [Clostridium tepidiprofundi DSM 19306]
MDKVNNILLSSCELSRYDENVISLTLFGSYNTKYWIEGKSDIDILVLIKHKNFDLEYNIEQYYYSSISKHFQYDKIHFTFIGLNDFDKVFADIYIDFEDKIIFDMDLHYDFLMYISKFNRVNENLINLVRRDWESKYGIL